MKNIYYKMDIQKVLKRTIICILLSVQTITYAQNGIIWQKCFGCPQGNGYENMCTSEGCYFLTGVYTLTGGDFNGEYGLGDVGLIKIDSNGNKLWSNHYGGARQDGCFSIIKGSTGGMYYIIGNTLSYNLPNFHGLATPPYKSDGYVICIDGSGNMLWQQCYGGFGWDWLVTAISDGPYLYAAGHTQNSKGGDTGGNYDPDTINGVTFDWFVCKINAQNGNLIHSKRFGGPQQDFLNKIIVTNDHNLLLMGFSNSDSIDVPVNYGGSDAWALKIDTAFNVLSSKVFGGSQSESFYDAVTTADNGYIMFGITTNTDTLVGNLDITVTSGVRQMMLIKTDSALHSQWQKTYGCYIGQTISADGSGANLLTRTPDNGYLMATRAIPTNCNAYPFIYGTTVFIKTDANGNQLYERYYGSDSSNGTGSSGGSDRIRSIIATPSGGFIVGSTSHVDNNNFCSSTGVNPLNFWNIFKWNNNLITGNEDMINKEKSISIYPNPSSTSLNFEGISKTTIAEVYDISGKFLLSKQLFENWLDIRSLAKGLYFIKLSTAEGSVVRKFVKE
jgi:hypothetical protein